MDIIYLHGLEVECVIGVWDWEREIKQKVIIDLDMAFDIRPASATDRLEDTLSYKEVSKRVSAYVGGSSFNLVETMAERVGRILLDEFELSWCRVKINKRGAVRGAGDVGVIIERGQVR